MQKPAGVVRSLRRGAMGVVGVLATVAAGACSSSPPEDPQLEHLGTSEAEVVIGTYTTSGQKLTVHEVGTMHLLTSRIASCSDGVLYSTRTDGTLWFNKNKGVGTWFQVNAGTMGTRIACDRMHLYALDSANVLWHAGTNSSGQLAMPTDGSPVWTTLNGNLGVPSGTTDIQGGLGNIYAIAHNSTTGISSLYSSLLPDGSHPGIQGSPGSWDLLASNLGIRVASGAGSLGLVTPLVTPSARPENRVYGANPDGTLWFNDKMLEKINGWSTFPNAGIQLSRITADASNILYGVASYGPYGLGKKLYRYEFEESNCTDGIDNDANGLIDAEDPVCQQKLATAYCQGPGSGGGTYCIKRTHSTIGFNNKLVTCNNGVATLKAGVCHDGGLGNDSLLAPENAVSLEPWGSGHYCNVVSGDGSWDARWEASDPDPCTTLLGQHPGATVVRAGLYSTQFTNDVLIRCTDGAFTTEGVGDDPISFAYNTVTHGNNKCILTVSPKDMRIFNAPIPVTAWRPNGQVGARGYSTGHMFDHARNCAEQDVRCPCWPGEVDCWIPLDSYGAETGTSNRIDHRGMHIGDANLNDQSAYDYGLDEGTPIRALGWGVVLDPYGSRNRDISGLNANGTSFQSEIFVQHTIGSVPQYAETFVAYYAHLRKRIVTNGQTVSPGQVLGYTGAGGSSSGPHLHFGLVRTSNTNGTLSANLAFGHHVAFDANPSHEWGASKLSVAGIVDPYGWLAQDIDPYGHYWSRAVFPGTAIIGIGAWGPSMWMSHEVPPYP